ncbi:hypothetical protein MGYG_02766 [Nannizzia gypsea CBS 118893]|uniref:DUF7492 domain-containing protein n=1 Tax=Arthroderma gypseum (strain ATCC MYA-4604 / CBS 118893) TaxID=535722 RepID=E4UP00_ARTGP|nr:hypothetical protein MGYG_02766 [Nannizzia gypsea CBS 118893]EFQ99753.1 hypothetical protein MGYG_02766 [Nannizzia gypsea CBS 118893]
MASKALKFMMLLFLCCFISTAHSHSWVEELDIVAGNGSFTGKPGYIRGHVDRTAQGFNDDLMTNRLPPNGRPADVGIIHSDYMCMPSQRNRRQTEGWPRLEATPGDIVALLYRENGHVTLPDNQPGKPKNRGTVHVYGTNNPRPDDKFLDIHKVWNKDGTGGDRRGKLLSRQNFDDGRCYQINGDKISTERQKKYPHVPDKLMGADVACQHILQLPSDYVVPGKSLSMYFVWDWPTAPGVDPNLPRGKTEIYTSCMDIDIVASKNGTTTASMAHFVDGQPLNRAAVPSLFANLGQSVDNSPSDVDSVSSTSVSSSSSDVAVPTAGSIVPIPGHFTTSKTWTTIRRGTHQPTFTP